MGIASAVGGAAVNAAALLAQKEALKKGKTPEQKDCIEFLYNLSSGGCGCLSKGGKMTMQQYMGIVQNKCQSLNSKEKAMAKIGLDPSQIEEIPPIVLSSFVYDDDCLIRVDDNVAVSSQYSITWIFFSATQMYTYKFIFDTTSDNTWEFTKDFFYTDITCFSTLREVKEKIDVAAATGCIKGEQITKNHYVVDTLEIIVPGTSYSFSLRNNPNIEQSIQAAKAMLREKKYSK